MKIAVVASANLKRWGLDDYYYTNPKEYRMHSEALKTIERISWEKRENPELRADADDPKTFSKACTETFTMAAKPEWDFVGLFEYVCEENNRCPGGKCQAP